MIELGQIPPDIQPQNESPVEKRDVLLIPVMVPAPISRNPKDWQEPTHPEDLRGLIQQTFKVRRFSEDPEIVKLVPDNTAAHLQRCAFIALNMRLPQFVDRQTLIRMTWLSDLPEGGLRTDSSAITRDCDPGLSRQIEEKELAVAREIFGENPNDMRLYSTFVESGRLLRGQEANMDRVTPEGIIAYTIDKVEANTYFFYWITHRPDLILTLSGRYGEYTMSQIYGVFRPIFEGDITVDVALVRCLNQIFLDQLGYIMERWARIPSERIPSAYKLFTRKIVACSPDVTRQFP